MNPTTYNLLIFVHVCAAAFWVGGMATMHFAVRPAAVALLQPPQRLPFMAGALERFFAGVSVAVLLLWASGLALLMGQGGMAGTHWRVHAMLTLALVMSAIYGHIRMASFKRLRLAVQAADWPAAAARLNQIRRLVALNLGLGVLTLAVALVGRAL
ncbi:CopD family protein [Xenophilus arseniciresistens]|uniref:CopD family protein n=1 Tax=Xenophilus arseniciresistens TaxID=1283306 RepID=A0AAE3ND35_9BURK|nr:CopD family protein [Xenophilus arseniciresistens]MDA7419183.1 CopD family protein [Xenophilus arseniciresistens]